MDGLTGHTHGELDGELDKGRVLPPGMKQRNGRTPGPGLREEQILTARAREV